jgi:ribosomal protein S18 acetylase RimI-like enzyme
MERSAVSSILRSNQAYHSQVCHTESLDWGIAYTSERFTGLACVNQFREVLIPNREQVADAFAEAEQYFVDRGLSCTGWTPSSEQDTNLIDELLVGKGYVRRHSTAMMLTEWRELSTDDSLRILPARPMRDAYQQLLSARASALDESQERLCIDAALERLDDPSYEMFVVMRGALTLGCGAMFEVGDIGRLIDFYISPDHRGGPAAESLSAHLLGITKRLALRMICVQAEGRESDWINLLERSGFERQGEMIEYVSPSPGVSLSC